jgi:hypothetical protein
MPAHLAPKPRYRRWLAAPVAAFLAAVMLATAVSVAAQKDRVFSAWSEAVTVTTLEAPEQGVIPAAPDPSLPAPEGVSAVAESHSAITVSWEPVDEADGYEVECSKHGAETVETAWTFTDLEPATEYVCRVRAFVETEPAGEWLDTPDADATPTPTSEPESTPTPPPIEDAEDPVVNAGGPTETPADDAEEPAPEPAEPSEADRDAAASSPDRDRIISNAGLFDPSNVPAQPEGTIRIQEAGAVIQNRHASFVSIEAPNVTLRNVRVTSGALYGVRNTEGHDGLVIEHSELDCTKAPGDTSACLISWGAHTLRNTVIRAHGADAVKTAGGATHVGNHIVVSKPSGSSHHTDGVQTRKGTGLTFVGNVIDAPAAQGGNAALIIQGADGPIRNVEIRGNYLSGGNYTVYTTQDIGGVTIVDNVFAPHMDDHVLGYRYGVIRNTASNATVRDNTFLDESPAP